MKDCIKVNFKLILCLVTLIVCVTIICVTGFSYAANNVSGTIYTRDELSEQIESLTEELNIEKSKISILQTKNFNFENGINALNVGLASYNNLHSSDVTWVNLIPNVNTSVVASVLEYLRYTIIGKLLIIDIGGISFKSVGGNQIWLQLPEALIPLTRGTTTISSADFVSGEPNYQCLVFNQPGAANVSAHVTVANAPMWGQLIWKIA